MLSKPDSIPSTPSADALFLLKRLSKVCAALVLAIGAITVFAWLFHAQLFGTVFPPDRLPFILSIKCNTGLGFIFLGLALWFSGPEKGPAPRWERARRFSALGAVFLGAATILEYALGVNFGLDQLLTPDDTVPGNTLPGRMGIFTAVDFCLLGPALGFPALKIPRVVQVSSLSALLGLFIALMAFIGHLYGARSFYVYSPFNYMALQTALAFIFSALGFLAAYPQKILGKQTGTPLEGATDSPAAGSLSSFAWTAISVILVFLLASAWISAENFFGLLRNDRMVLHSQQVLDSLEKIRASVNDLTTSAHDYCQGGRREDLSKFSNARQAFQNCLGDALGLTADNGAQQSRLTAMGRLVDHQALALEPFLKWKSSRGGWTPARQGALLGLEEDFRGRYRDLLVAARQEENDLLARRAQEADQSIHQTGWAFAFTLGTALSFIGYTLLLWRRDNRRQSQLRETELKLTTVIQNAPMIFFTFDSGGVVGVSEGRGLGNLGIRPGASVGQSIFDLYRTAPEIIQNTRRALAGEKFTSVVPLRGKFLEMSYTPVKDGEGRVVQVLGVALDVTERAAAEEKLRHYTHRLEDNNRDLQEFVFVASHDLQEPLRKIQAFGGFLAEELGDKASENALGYLKRMRDAAARMGALIEDLLQWTRVSTRGKPFVPVELSQVLKDVTADLEIALQEAGGKVESGPLPLIDADPAQMWQLFQNLISNSLKFRKKGAAPVVTLGAEVQGPANKVVLTFQDNGIGFEQKYADKIFNIFQRLHGPQEYKGSGVGLAVCRKVVERHNGGITARGVLGEGAAFEITLPIRQAKTDPREAEPYRPAESRAV